MIRRAKWSLLVGVSGMVWSGQALAQQSTTSPDPDRSPAPARAAADANPQAGRVADDIIVTARRTNERLQDVPIALSVVTPATLDSKGTFTPIDLAKTSPGLTVNASFANRNNVTYTIRGQGFSFGTLFPAVITYFNEVPITQLTTGQFFDLANVQVLRGPQGINFGRVTDGGNVLVSPQKPKNEFGGYVEARLGDYNLHGVTGVLNVPLVDDKVLLRGAFDIARRDGFTKNDNDGRRFDNLRYEAYRVGLTLRPTDTLENYTVVAYQRTHDNGTGVVGTTLLPDTLLRNISGLASLFPGAYGIDGNGNVVPNAAGLTPFTGPNYVASQQALFNAQQARGPRHVDVTNPNYTKRSNLYLVNTTTAQLGAGVTLTNVFGYTNVVERLATNYSGLNGAAILLCEDSCGFGGTVPFNQQQQFSEDLRFSGKLFNDAVSWTVGGYADRQKPTRAIENDAINLAILERDVIQYSTTKSRAGYASAEYDAKSWAPGLKFTGGVRYTHDTVSSLNAFYARPIPGTNDQAALAAVLPFVLQAQGVPAATAGFLAPLIAQATFQPIPHGQCTDYGTIATPVGPIASLFGASSCVENRASFNATTWTGGVSYKVQSGPLLYAKISRGYRPGGVNATAPVGSSPVYQPETDTSIELGAKANLNLDGVIVRANLAAYTDRYKSIQKSLLFTINGNIFSLVRNVANGRVSGVEFDGSIVPLRGLTLGGSAAYTRARYDRDVAYDPASCDPNALTFTGFCPFNRFNYTPKFQYTLNASYAAQLGNVGKLELGANFYHQASVALLDTSRLNPFSIEHGYGLLDLTAGVSNVAGYPIDVTFFMTNVTNKTYRIGSNDLATNSSLGFAGSIYGAPRMFGVNLKYRFGSDAR